MLNDQAIRPEVTVAVRPWNSHLPIGLNRLRAVVGSAARAVASWARIPILPDAALWEASLWARQTDPRDGCVDPDAFSCESPFLRDGWPLA